MVDADQSVRAENSAGESSPVQPPVEEVISPMPPADTSKKSWSYLNLLTEPWKDSDWAELVASLGVHNLTEALHRHLAFLHNVTSDVDFSTILNNKWKDVQLMENANDAAKHAREGVENIVQEVQAGLVDRWRQFQRHANVSELQQRLESYGKILNQTKDKITNTTAVERFQGLFNRTKENVATLGKKVSKTWKKVQNLSKKILKKNKTLRKFGDTVQKNIQEFGMKLQQGWDSITEQFKQTGWLSPSTSDDKHKTAEARKPPKKMAKGKGKPKPAPQQQHSTFANIPAVDVNDLSSQVHGQNFERRPHHKQKQSRADDNQEYVEFWEKSSFNPDDFLYEGFFEGNNREWHKQQKRLRKLYGRLQQLNEDIFLTMDDDDMEEMYEDWEDVEDEFEDQDYQPEQLKTWLTCQVRWWKSRMHRKHSQDEDLIKSCGRMLMRWQLKATCRPRHCAQKGKRCKNRGASNSRDSSFVDSARCEYLLATVMMNSVSDGDNTKPGATGASWIVPEQQQHDRNDQTEEIIHFDGGSVENENSAYGRLLDSAWVPAEDENVTATDVEWSSEDHNDAGLWETSEESAVPDTQPDLSDVGGRAQWLFERAEDRESHHHDATWQFHRVGQREFERNKPWYYKRADDREYQRSQARLRHHPGAAHPRHPCDSRHLWRRIRCWGGW